MQFDDQGPRNRLCRRAAAIAIAAALGALSAVPMAAIVDSGPVNITIPNTLDGVYVNWLTGASGVTGAAVPGWDINPYAIGSGTLLDLFAPNGASKAIVGLVATAAAASLPVGAMIGGTSTFVQGVTSGVALRTTATHYVGIRFMNEGTGAINYGYALVRTTAPGGFPAAIVRYVYDNAGGGIVTPVLPPMLQSVVSRRVQGAAGTFDLPLSQVPTQPTTEPRLGPQPGDLTLVFTFDRPLTTASIAVTEGTGTLWASQVTGSEVLVILHNVADQFYTTVTLNNVGGVDGSTGGSASARVGMLAGDVNGSRAVTLVDVGQVNAQLAQPVTGANYLRDVDASGTLTLADKAIANTNLTHALPPP